MTTKILVCNIGSSSLKFQLIDMDTEQRLARGQVERVGSGAGHADYWLHERLAWTSDAPVPGHREAVRQALYLLAEGGDAAVDSLEEIQGVGFKCVQAGDKNGSVLLSQDVLDAMEFYKDLAPAHNPPYLEAISMFRERLPWMPLVGVFEPGFHGEIPDYARIYGTPLDWIEKYGVRKYGYHGASHRFVTGETIRILALPPDDHNIISCHLGGSSSLCAFKNGTSIDTSMGFSPQSGLIQGTRIGDLDPFVLPYIMKKKGISLEQALEECSGNAGLAGLSGTSGDMRDILCAIEEGSQPALLARRKFLYDIKRYVGEYLVLMEGLDAIAFTGGIGQKDSGLREEVLSSLVFLGLELDSERNRNHRPIITSASSRIAALVVPTDEEIVVARETARVLRDLRGQVTARNHKP